MSTHYQKGRLGGKRRNGQLLITSVYRNGHRFYPQDSPKSTFQASPFQCARKRTIRIKDHN